MMGQIDLEITLASSGVLGLGASPVAAALAQVTAANSEIGIAIPAATQFSYSNSSRRYII
jgi:hypothetical protein